MSPVFPDDNPVVRGCLRRPRRALSEKVVKELFFAGSDKNSVLSIANLHLSAAPDFCCGDEWGLGLPGEVS